MIGRKKKLGTCRIRALERTWGRHLEQKNIQAAETYWNQQF
jgi:hypothetical protein